MKVEKVVPLPLERVAVAVNEWLAARPEHFCTEEIWGVFDGPQWREREEDYGNTATGTLLLNEAGVLRQLVNFDWLGADADALYAEFTDLLACHGYMHELGYSWTLHLYPLDA